MRGTIFRFENTLTGVSLFGFTTRRLLSAKRRNIIDRIREGKGVEGHLFDANTPGNALVIHFVSFCEREEAQNQIDRIRCVYSASKNTEEKQRDVPLNKQQ